MNIESVQSFPTRVFTINSREAFLQTMSKFILISRFILNLRIILKMSFLKSKFNQSCFKTLTPSGNRSSKILLHPREGLPLPTQLT